MKNCLSALLSLCLFALAACHKDSTKPPVTSTDSTLKIDLINSENGWSDTVKTDVELIISEPGGKILLDTITPANTRITLTLNTNATTVNLTNIDHPANDINYYAITYVGVNPANWACDYFLNYEAPSGPHPSSFVNSTLTYTNISSSTATLFTQNAWMFQPGYHEDLTNPNAITFTYSRLPGNYAYFLDYTTDRYKMVLPTQANQTVDCSTMDQTTSANFTPSSYFNYYESYLWGYPDSTNLNSVLQLYSHDTGWVAGTPELEYPTKNIQKYAMEGRFYSPNNEYAFVYSLSNTINLNLSYPDPNSYSLGSTKNSNFAISWNGTKPTYYFTYWSANNISWGFVVPPDSTTFNPLGLMTAQGSKILQGMDLTRLTLAEFYYNSVKGYNYSGYLGLMHDSTQYWKNPISSSIIYIKNFGYVPGF